MNYLDYIRSVAWREKREAYWQSKYSQNCYVCGLARQPGFHLHHVTYERLGRERLSDLVPVCEPHHDAIHKNHKKFPRMSLREATRYTRDAYLTEQKTAANKQWIIDHPYTAQPPPSHLFGKPRKKRMTNPPKPKKAVKRSVQVVFTKLDQRKKR